MGRLLLFLLGLVFLVVVAALVVPFFIPTDVYRTQAQSAVKQATGRDLTIGGDFSFSLLPSVSVRMSDVTFANAAWGEAENLAEVKDLTVGVKLVPLIFGQRIEISRFVLTEPRIALEVNPQGEANWEFEGTPGEATTTQADTGATEASGDFTGGLQDISLGDVRLVNGTVSFVDRSTLDENGQPTAYDLSDINVSVGLPSLDGPLTVDGGVGYNGETISLDTRVAAPRGLIEGQGSALSADLRSDLFSVTFDGDAVQRDGSATALGGSGTLDLNVPSVRALSAWAGSPMEEGEGFGPLAVKGDMQSDGNVITFENATLAFDAMEGEGAFGVDLRNETPKLTGKMELNQIDTRPYEGASETGDAGGSGGQPAPAGEDEGWSDEPIDLSALKSVDADFEVTTGAVMTSTLKMGRSAVRAALEGGLLTVDLQELNLYEGGGALFVQVDARNDNARITNRTKLSTIQAAPLLKDLMGSSILEGLGNVELELSTQGRSQRDFVQALNGTGALVFNDGAFYGINLAELYRTGKELIENPATAAQRLTSLALPNLDLGTDAAASSTRKTDFAELSAPFSIQSGVLTMDNLQLLNPFIRVSGGGESSLVERTADFLLQVRAVASTEGQGADGNGNGITVPIALAGPWDAIRPDLRRVAEDALRNRAGEELERVVPGGGDILRNPGGALRGLLGGNRDKDKDDEPRNDL